MSEPWHDTPLCGCGGPQTTLDRGHSELIEGSRVRCCACGKLSTLDEAEYQRALRADLAWLRNERAPERVVGKVEARAACPREQRPSLPELL